MRNFAFLVCFTLFSSLTYAGSPCLEIDRSLDPAYKQALLPIIAKQLNLPKVKILESLRYQDWQIIYVATYVSDETFLFFHGDPLKTRYITEWGGAATFNETEEIRDWVLQYAKGIPEKLAYCFAWRVTKGQ